MNRLSGLVLRSVFIGVGFAVCAFGVGVVGVLAVPGDGSRPWLLTTLVASWLRWSQTTFSVNDSGALFPIAVIWGLIAMAVALVAQLVLLVAREHRNQEL